MADREVDHLLVGGGIAAATCAAALREEGAEGSVLLVGRELDPPYHRPPLSKGYLQGREDKDSLLIEVPGDVEVLTRTSVMEIDTAAKVATLSTKEQVAFSTALVATGSMVRRVSFDGSDLEAIHYLRAPMNADAIRRDVESAQRAVLVGGSFIGCEVAASLASTGRQCTIVMLEAEPLERAFGRDAGAYIRRLLTEHGVEVIGEAEVARFEGDGRVAAVVLGDGRSVAGEVVLCGTGAIPDVMLARKSGLDIGERGGVLCDATLRSSAPGIYAAGDMCEFDSVLHGGHVRIEHEEVAAAHGRTVARNMLGAGAAHDEVPYFWTDLADWATLEYVSTGSDFDEEVVEGSLDDGAFAIRYLQGGRLRAYLRAGDFGDVDGAVEELRAAR